MGVLAGRAAAAVLAPAAAAALDNGLARAPPLGWSSWNGFGIQQSEELMRTTADALVATGLRDAGYVHLDIDGGWFEQQGGALNASGFPTSPWDVKGLADYMHARQLKLGMYVTGGFPMVYEHEDAWAAVMFSEWGADAVKVDHMCKVPACARALRGQIAPAEQRPTMERWRAAIAKVNATRRVLFQNCGVGCAPALGPDSGKPRPWGEWCRDTANLWRSSTDIAASWGSIVGNNLASLVGRGGLSRPGGWNYPDGLEVGVAKLSPAQARAHFSLWCITSSPLYLGMDVRSIAADDLAIVSNKDALMVNQAWAGFAGDMLNASLYPPSNPRKSNVTGIPPQSVWWKPLPGGEAAAVLFNSGGAAANISFRFGELRWAGKGAVPAGGACRARSVWGGGRDAGPFTAAYAAAVPPQAVHFVILHSCA